MEHNLPTDLLPDFGTIKRLLVQINREIGELEQQGLVDEDNLPAIISHLASTHYFARKAKWKGVEHLRVKADDELM